MNQELINKAHKFRMHLETARMIEEVYNCRVKESPLYLAYFQAMAIRKQCEIMVAGFIEQLKAEALAEFKATGEKKPFGLINVNTKKVVKPYDMAKAIEWCRVNSPVTLTVDREAFETLALAGKVPFVEIEEIPNVTKVASDFSAVALVEA